MDELLRLSPEMSLLLKIIFLLKVLLIEVLIFLN